MGREGLSCSVLTDTVDDDQQDEGKVKGGGHGEALRGRGIEANEVF